MTAAQAAWWRQAGSDLGAFDALRAAKAHDCHLLHYLQMAAEKIGKAYFARNGRPAPKSHAAVQLFLKLLAVEGRGATAHLAAVFHFGTVAGFRAYLRSAGPLAERLEALAPDLAGDGPNPEYPWPHADPATAPTDIAFPLWRTLETDPAGRRFLAFLRTAIRRFPDYA